MASKTWVFFSANAELQVVFSRNLDRYARWWFQIQYFLFSPLLGEMILFDKYF